MNLLDRYLEITKNCDMQITSRIARNVTGTIRKNTILEFLQNAYIFNRCIKDKYKNYNQIFKKYKYKIYHAAKNSDDIKKIVDLHYRLRKKHGQSYIINSNENFLQNMCTDIMLISNCLDMLEDYELLYNECFKYEKVYSSKTSLVFIALKLNKNEKQSFKNFHPINYITNINNMTDLELDFKAIYLEKRSPLGDFLAEENSDYILGEKIVKNSRKPEIEILKVCFKTIIYRYFGNQRIINSMQCIIACSDVQNNQNENFNIINFTYSEPENFKLFVLTIYYEDAVFNINVYYTKKLIEDIETERKKVYMINVYIYIGRRTYLQLVSKYVYYMKFYDEKFSYSFFHDKKVISDDLIEVISNDSIEVISDDSICQNFKAKKLISNLKSHMCNSLMNLDINFDYNKIKMDDYINVVSVKASTLSAILVPWDYSNIKNSINNLLCKLKFDLDSKPKVVLCKYHLCYSIFDDVVR
ncbi:hypothetical protein COBT_003542, partial [Conglomerata obtusa]